MAANKFQNRVLASLPENEIERLDSHMSLVELSLRVTKAWEFREIFVIEGWRLYDRGYWLIRKKEKSTQNFLVYFSASTGYRNGYRLHV